MRDWVLWCLSVAEARRVGNVDRKNISKNENDTPDSPPFQESVREFGDISWRSWRGSGSTSAAFYGYEHDAKHEYLISIVVLTIQTQSV